MNIVRISQKSPAIYTRYPAVKNVLENVVVLDKIFSHRDYNQKKFNLTAPDILLAFQLWTFRWVVGMSPLIFPGATILDGNVLAGGGGASEGRKETDAGG